eukprot:1064196-Prymnesium_polylepis.1
MSGGTAEQTVEHIRKEIFEHGHVVISKRKEHHERMWGEGSWAADGMPPPDSLGLHRLSEHVLIMGDSCSTMRKTQRLLVTLAEAAGRERIGEERWNGMSEAERALT